LVLANAGATVGPFSANTTSFTFGPVLTVGSNYSVSVQTQPTGLTCSVAKGSGTAGAANVTDVVVTCSSQSYKLGGTISGLTAGGLQLSNGTDILSVPANATTFTFDQQVAYTSAYAVGVASQPTGLTCSVSNGTGTMPAADVTNVQVSCSPKAYSVGGTITGLTQPGLVLANGGDHLTVSPNTTSFTMPQPVADGSGYAVIVQTQPTGQTCTVANGTGTMGAANVSNVVVNCTLDSYSLGGSISGLNLGGAVVVSNLVLANGSDTLTVPFGSTSFTFHSQVAYGSSYNVVVKSQPTLAGLIQLTCTVAGNGSGTMVGPVNNVLVNCGL
jgi:hypothetical protein